jgi:hypothetical protein
VRDPIIPTADWTWTAGILVEEEEEEEQRAAAAAYTAEATEEEDGPKGRVRDPGICRTSGIRIGYLWA